MAIILINGERAIPISHVPAWFRAMGVPPERNYTHRKLAEMANDGLISPPFERYGDRFWMCRVSWLPELARLLGLSLDELTTGPASPAPPNYRPVTAPGRQSGLHLPDPAAAPIPGGPPF